MTLFHGHTTFMSTGTDERTKQIHELAFDLIHVCTCVPLGTEPNGSNSIVRSYSVGFLAKCGIPAS